MSKLYPVTLNSQPNVAELHLERVLPFEVIGIV